MSYEFTGKVLQIKEEQTFGSGFNKQAFVVTDTDSQYPQEIEFEVVKDKVRLLNGIRTGDKVTVHFDLRGREWNGRHFVSLNAWKVSRMGETRKPQPEKDERQQEWNPDDELDESEIPF